MKSCSAMLLVAMPLAILLSGCVATPQKDGSTLLRLNIPGLTPSAAPAATQPSEPSGGSNAAEPAPSAAAPSGVPITQTALSGLFTKHPYGGTGAGTFPRVALTFTDWSRSDCWTADAVIWWGTRKSERVRQFYVCPRGGLGTAINGAAGLHLFVEQTSALSNTGNVRGDGPTPPMLAVPMTMPIPPGTNMFNDVIMQIIADTGWQAGAPVTDFWIVGFKKSS